MERKVLLAPSLLAANPLNISGSIEKLEGNYDWFHLDIMDGHFVKNLSFGPEHAKALRKAYPDAFIDAHLMVDNHNVVLPLFMNSGADLITVHAEVEPQFLHATLSNIKKAGIKAGVSLCPATPVANIEHVLELVDLVLIMSVTPGFGGQKFIENSLKKVRELVSLREANKFDYVIEIDGGINENNAARIALAGVDVLVAGSSVFDNENPAQWLKTVRANIKEALENLGRA